MVGKGMTCVRPSPSAPTASGYIARGAIKLARIAGHDCEALIRQAGLRPDELADTAVRILAERQINLLNCTAAALSDDLLGMHLAKSFDPREVGLIYFVLASSETLSEAIARAERYVGLVNDGVGLKQLGHGRCGFRYSYVGVPRHIDRHQVEFWATIFAKIAKQLTGALARPSRVTFAHGKCAREREAEAIIGCRIEYQATHDEVEFAPSAGALPLSLADPYLNELLVKYCEDALDHRVRPVEALRTRVENAIAPVLPHGGARISKIAGALGMSPRSLRRRLATEGFSFSQILHEMRADLANHYLQDSRMPLSEIAWLLGFQQLSAFTHFFKRTMGRAPSTTRGRSRTT
jgi:AraC-like DNA-binding protein